MNFLETLHAKIDTLGSHPPLLEVRGTQTLPMSAKGLRESIARARTYLQSRKIQPGDRVVLIGPNSVSWVASDLAILAEGAISVPLYSRQKKEELLAMARDARPKLVIIADETFRLDTLPCVTYEQLFAPSPTEQPPHPVLEDDPVTIVYTSGTSGVAKGVILARKNFDYMIPQAMGRLWETTGRMSHNDRIFHFLPFCFAGARVMLWTQLCRGNSLMISTDLSNLAQEMKTAVPNYFQTVPMVLERIRSGVAEKINAKGGMIASLYRRAERGAGISRWIASRAIYPRLKKQIGPYLEFIICGSAPLNPETQRWFERIGFPILQVYGLTETTAIVTMDRRETATPGRVGEVIPGVEVKLTEEGEMICRGPNLFSGYWNRPEETAAVLKEGWFYSGDRAEQDSRGQWKILGRVNSTIVPASGHNVTPEPIEEQLKTSCPGVEHAVVVGHGRPYLSVLISGDPEDRTLVEAVEQINQGQPHYRKIKKYRRVTEKFTPDNGLLTANLKLRRRAIESQMKDLIEEIYR